MELLNKICNCPISNLLRFSLNVLKLYQIIVQMRVTEFALTWMQKNLSWITQIRILCDIFIITLAN